MPRVSKRACKRDLRSNHNLKASSFRDAGFEVEILYFAEQGRGASSNKDGGGNLRAVITQNVK